jgi:chorismate synthase
MAGNSYGTLLGNNFWRISMGGLGIIDGCPSGIEINLEAIQLEMSRSQSVSNRYPKKEPDDVQFLSIFEGKTGTQSVYYSKYESKIR